MKKAPAHEKFYKDSPKLERGEDKKIHVVKKKKEEKHKMEDHESGKGHEDAVMKLHNKHSRERLAMHQKHEAEHLKMMQDAKENPTMPAEQGGNVPPEAESEGEE